MAVGRLTSTSAAMPDRSGAYAFDASVWPPCSAWVCANTTHAAKHDHLTARLRSIKGLHREADMLNYSIFLNSWKGVKHGFSTH